MFGGGADKAEAELTEAQKLFEQEPPDRAWPNWGRAEVLAWLGQTMVKKKDFERAREYYQEALALEPNYAWVRDMLLPALEKRTTEEQ